jgi:hypothetical protein
VVAGYPQVVVVDEDDAEKRPETDIMPLAAASTIGMDHRHDPSSSTSRNTHLLTW